MKKLLSALLAATMVFSSVVMSVSAETGITVPDGLTAATAPGPNDSVTMMWDDEALSCEGGKAPNYLPTYSYNGITYKSTIFDGKNIDYYVTATAETAGTYTLQAILRAPYTKYLGVKVNDVQAIDSVKVVNGSSTDYSLTDIGTVTLAEGVNKISLGPDANGNAADNIYVAGIVLNGAYVAPASVTAKQLNLDGTVTIPYTDAAIQYLKTNASDRTFQYNGYTDTFTDGTTGTSLNSNVKVYVYAPEAGTYKIQYTGAYTAYTRTLYLFVNGELQHTVAASGGLLSTTAATPAAGAVKEITLEKGYNLIQVDASNTNTGNSRQQAFSQIAISGPMAPPAGVTPVAVSNATQAVAAVGSTAFSGTVYTNTSAASYGYANGTPIASFNTTNGVYVNAAQAGTYKVYITWCDQFQSRTRDIVVNGVVQQAGVALGGFKVDGKDPWYHALGRSPEYEITLRQGVNSIIFQPGGTSSGATETQNAWSAITVTGDCYGLPTIDTAANEGDVRLTWQAEAATSADIHANASSYELEVNCLTAGDYYFIPYYQRSHTDGSLNTVTVNGVDVATPNNTCAGASQVTAFGYTVFKAVPVKVALNAGKNTIVFKPNSTNVHADKFELVNFAVVEPNSTTSGQYPYAQFAYAGFITETTTLASSPKVITKDKISQTIPANVATANVTALFSDFVSGTYARQLVLASYDANGKLLNVKLGTGNVYGSYAHQLNISGLDLTGAETVKIMVLDDLTNLTRSSFKEFTK